MSQTPKALKIQVANIAAGIVDGSIDPLDGCRQIVSLRNSLSAADSSDPDLLFLVGLESELDDVPTASSRALWAPDALAMKDREALDYLEVNQDEMLRACRALNAKWKTAQ